MKTPVGLGFWLAFPKMIGDGKPGTIVSKLLGVGAKWVAPRGGDGGNRDNAWTKAHTAACNAAGIPVYRWQYSRGATWQKQVPLAQAFQDEGDAGYIDDAEAHWEVGGDFRSHADAYMTELDKKLGRDYYIADAPWPYIYYHMKPNGEGFPAKQFAGRCNARMPQCYWSEVSAAGAQHHLPAMDAQWARFDKENPTLARPVLPIGITYGRSEIQKWGASQLPPGEIKVEDVAFAYARYCTRLAHSYYSLEAASSAVLGYFAALATPPPVVRPSDAPTPVPPTPAERPVIVTPVPPVFVPDELMPPTLPEAWGSDASNAAIAEQLGRGAFADAAAALEGHVTLESPFTSFLGSMLDRFRRLSGDEQAAALAHYTRNNAMWHRVEQQCLNDCATDPSDA